MISEIQAQQPAGKDFDVLHYQVTITPNIPNKTFEGFEIITLTTNNNEIALNCRGLTIKDVQGNFVKDYVHKNNKLIIAFNSNDQPKREVQITYSGTENRGLKFYPENNQLHTTYFTEEWMACHNTTDDRSTIETRLILPNDLTSIATGLLSTKETDGQGQIIHSWRLDEPAPAYTYGFVAGKLNSYIEEFSNTILNYYSHNYNGDQLKQIFETTGDILAFFEDRSGVPYFQKSYSQFLGPGNVSQEVCGFAILRNGYGKQVLEDSTQINLSAHELAHQWWGNMITCKSYSHFWLNEAMAVYMSSLYKERRFGRKKYEEDIEVYLRVYEKVKNDGEDKSLVFDNWDYPTRNDRNIVYYKGAYVLHLLREKLGDEKFWSGIKNYSQKYFGSSVTTQDFQTAMEASSGQNLQSFFDRWVY